MSQQSNDPVKSLVSSLYDVPDVDSAVPGLYAEETPTPVLGYEFDPARQIASGFNKGVKNIEANTNYFKAMIDSMTGQEQAMRDSIYEAEQAQTAGSAASYVDSAAAFERAAFENGTFEDFMNAALGFTGEIAPSAVATVGTALVGTAIAALTSPATVPATLVGATGAAITKKTAEGVTTRLAKQGLTRKMVTEAVEAASKKQALSNKQKKIMDAVYKNFQAQMYKRRLTRGGIAGAAAQEYPQMSGTFFGNFADQGMTDPVNALQAGLLGVPATVIGVGTEKIVFDAVTDVFKNSGGRSLLTPAGKQSSQIGKKALTSVGVSSGAEGLAETGQTAIEVAQKFAIDDEYTRQQAKLDLATSAFAGAVGGFGMGGAATTASSITAKANELLQTNQQKEALQQMYRAKYGEGGPGVVKEPASYIKAQIDAMMDPTNKKTNVWIDVNSYDQWNTIADEVLKQYPNLKGYDMGNPETGLGGILLSADPEQIQSFKQIMELNTPSTKLLDDALSSFLSYPRSRLATDTHVVEVKNKDGVPVHYHQTSAINEDGQTHLEQAKQLFGNNPEYTYELVDGETHLDARSEAVAPTENLIEDTDLDSMQENLDFREFENDFQETIESEVPTKIEDTGKVETKTFINQNKKPWSAPDENYENTQPSPELVAEARALVDPAFREEFDKNIRDNKYSRLLLQRYVQVSDVYFDAERTYKIEEQDGGYVIAPYATNPMQRAEGFESIKSDLDAAVRRAKDTKRARQSRWQIASNDGTSRAVDMPNLLNNYLRVLRRTGVIDSNQNYRQQLADTFTTLVGSLLESDNQKLTFKFDDISDATFSDPEAVVYTEEDGNLTFTLGQLFEAAREQEDKPLTKPEKRLNNRFGIDPRNRNLVRQKADELQERIGTEQEGEFDSSDLETLERVLNEGAFDPMQDLGPEQISEEEGDPIFNEMPADEQWDAEQASWAKQQFTKIKQKPGARPKNVTISQDFVNSFGVNKAIIEQLIKTATDKLNITKEIKVFTTRESENIDVGDENVNKYLNERKDYVLSKDSIKGINIEMRDYDVIILKVGIDPDLDLQGLYYKRLGHEIGHSFLRTELLKTLGNPKIRAKLIKEFNKAKEKSPEVGQWQQANGMEEWASDKIGAYLFDLDKGQVLQAKNIGESVLLRIAKSIKAFENSIRPQISVVQNRFAFSETFAEYVNGVLDAAKEPSTRENDTTYMEKAHIEDMLDAVFPPKVGEKQVKRINDEAQRIIKNGKMPKWFKKLFYDAHSFLGTLGADTGVGKDIADIFHTVSGNQKDVGFINEANRRTNQFINRLVGILRDDDNINVLTGTDKAFTKEEVAVFKEASNEKLSDAELSPKAQQVRKFLFDIYDELELSKYDIERRPNFFPRILHIQDIASKDAKRATLIKLLAERNNITEEEATKNVEKTIKKNQKDPNLATKNDDFEIGMQKDRAKLYEALDSETLLNEGLILPPEIAILEYVRKAVRRAEYEKRGGAARVNVLVNQLPAEERAQAKEAIDAMLGNINPIKNDMWRKITGGGLLLNVLNLLGMAVFASIPDAAGPILRSRNTDLKTVGKNLYQAMGQKEGARLAKSIGTNGVEAAATTILYAGEMDMLDQWGRKLSNGWFKYTQLERWTMFTRKFAAGMGRDFLLKHAETIKNGYEGDQDYLLSERYLKELNVTADQILAAQGQDIDAHPEVAAAMGRFVDESIVRPNAAERPIWASDPNFALVWQLKSFYYAYGKNIMGGLIREGKARKGETGHIADGVAPLLFGASLLMPLTMLGWDLRERFKIGLSWLLPGISPNDPGVNYRASQSMSSGEYWFDVLDRSGQLGPFALAIPLFMEDKRYGNPFFVPILGPSAEKAWDVATGDFDGYKWLPVYGQLDTRALGR
jgi:hypothetical protein